MCRKGSAKARSDPVGRGKCCGCYPNLACLQTEECEGGTDTAFRTLQACGVKTGDIGLCSVTSFSAAALDCAGIRQMPIEWITTGGLSGCPCVCPSVRLSACSRCRQRRRNSLTAGTETKKKLSNRPDRAFQRTWCQEVFHQLEYDVRKFGSGFPSRESHCRCLFTSFHLLLLVLEMEPFCLSLGPSPASECVSSQICNAR